MVELGSLEGDFVWNQAKCPQKNINPIPIIRFQKNPVFSCLELNFISQQVENIDYNEYKNTKISK